VKYDQAKDSARFTVVKTYWKYWMEQTNYGIRI
jgi:hypothetical protein